MKPLLGPFLAAAVLVSLPWLARATPPEAAKRQPTASFSTPAKPVEGRMVLRNRTGDALAQPTRGLVGARPDLRWPIHAEAAPPQGCTERGQPTSPRHTKTGTS